jgi:hypothetical protein
MFAETFLIGALILSVITNPIAADAMIPAMLTIRIVVYPDPAAPAVPILLNPRIAIMRKITVKRR